MSGGRILRVVLGLGAFLVILTGGPVRAEPSFGVLPGGEIGWARAGAPIILANGADYSWWHGCSPTSAGMIMGYYDRNGYQGQAYGNLVAGGVAEASTYGPGPYLANSAIASAGHINDFYRSGYLGSGDDLPAPWHGFDCLADYMGTSQDSVGNVNGSTTFYFWTNGAPFTAADAWNYNVWNADGTYGIGEYLAYAGYEYTALFTQLIASPGAPLGFTFEQYMAEIDAGRPMLIQVEGHTMFGYGYDAAGRLIYLHDTWGEGTHSMTWGGSYSGLTQWGVVGLTLTVIPEPSAALLMGSGGLLLAALSGLRRRAA